MELARTDNVQINLETIIRRINKANVHPRRSATGPLLTAAHRRARLEFAGAHLGWNPTSGIAYCSQMSLVLVYIRQISDMLNATSSKKLLLEVDV